MALVDSATVVLKRQGSQTEYFLRLNKENNLLHFSLDGFSAGEWTASLYIYSRFNDKGGRQYRQSKTFTLPLAGAAPVIDAPTGVATDAWKIFVFIRDNDYGVSITVPTDATDPYFDIQVADSKWNYFYVERTALLRHPGTGNEQMATAHWLCNNSCYTHDRMVRNTTAFIPFTQVVATKNWDNGETLAIVRNEQTGQERQYFCPFNK
jgi:hypothetical protein